MTIVPLYYHIGRQWDYRTTVMHDNLCPILGRFSMLWLLD